MFNSSYELTTIYAGNWNLDKLFNEYQGLSVFSGCTNLVGGKGTVYDEEHTDHTYARIDGGPEAPGYFTYKASTDINAIMYDNTKETPIYNLSGQRITSPQKGINIINGKKVMMK